MNDEYDDNEFPLAYLITIRCYGTWFPGDERGSVDRQGHNLYGAPRRPPNKKLEKLMHQELQQPPILLIPEQRKIIEAAICEVCEHRGYDLKAVNARSNHVHVVVSAQSKPEPIREAFKSYATRRLREAKTIDVEIRPWARGGSRRYLWKTHNVLRAIEYVLCQYRQLKGDGLRLGTTTHVSA
jgi:REP element-mobilizing transposase RayT